MSDTSSMAVPPPSRAMSRKTAIVGVGESDYALDYQAARTKTPGFTPKSTEELTGIAFERALAESGLRRDQIDGISVSFLYGGAAPEETAAQLGLTPRHAVQGGGIMAGPLQRACADILSGKCDTIALVYAVASHSIARQYGGATYGGYAETPASYYYYHPWGWSSQAAHWAMLFTYYQQVYGVSEADLGAVAVQLRRNAMANPNAVMRTPITIEDYLASRYIVRPLHLFDMCMVNDGAVCLILTKADLARDLSHDPVFVAGWGEAKIRRDKMSRLVRERLRPEMLDAGAQALAMAGLERADIGHFEGYDASSIYLISQIEGYGFVEPGEGLHFCQEGGMARDGRLPTNMAGGMMSGSYMHGWNLVAEIVRQLRHEAGERQVADLQASIFSMAQTDQVHPILFTREG